MVQLELRLLRTTRTKTLLGLSQQELETVRTTREATSIRYDMWDERYIVQRYRILQEHEGDLRIDSRPDDGTEVVILVPIRTATE